MTEPDAMPGRSATLSEGAVTAAHFAIVDAADDSLLGSISRHPLRGHHATTDVIRLELYTEAENSASGRVAERAGFAREGIRLAWDVDRDGHPIDAVFYVRIRK